MNTISNGMGDQQAPAIPLRFHLRDGRTCVVRMAVEGDAEELCELVPKFDTETDFLTRFPGEFDKTVEQERTFIREHAETQGGIFLVGEVAGRIVAVGGASPEKLKRFMHRREFGLAVLEAFWRQSIGRRLTAIIIDWARHQGLRKLGLKVVHHNHAAIALYKSFGFVEEGCLTGDVLLADGSYGHTILMAKFLCEPSAKGDGQAMG